MINLTEERARVEAAIAGIASSIPRRDGREDPLPVLLAFAEEMLRLHYMVPIPHLLRPSCGRCGMAWPCEERERIVACARECGIEVPDG